MAKVLWCVLTIIVQSSTPVQGACPRDCTCNTHDHYVDCSSAGLDRIPWNLPDPSGLKQIAFKGNKVKEIVTEIVSYNNLEYLDLSSNQIVNIGDFALSSLPKLKYLLLQHNQLQQLSTSVFRNLKSLLELDISNNQINTIEAHTYSQLSQLVRLDLHGNFIHTIENDAFIGLTSLKYISLSRNHVSKISAEWWQNSPAISMIYLDKNHITSVDSASFHSLPHLQSVSLDSNLISEISDTAFSINLLSLSNVSSLEQLSLKDNKLSDIPTQLLVHLPHLISLDLSGNSITTIQPNVFKGLHKLKQLYLNKLPKLTIIRQNAFAGLTSLKSIQISSNVNLYKIEMGAFPGTSDLKSVDLHRNVLTTVDSNLLDWLNLDMLDLRDNPWTCDCQLSFLTDVLLYNLNKAKTEAYYDVLKTVRCASPKELANKALIEVDDYNCTESDQPLIRRPVFRHEVVIVVTCLFTSSIVFCLLVILCRTKKIAFNNEENNQPRVTLRRPRRQDNRPDVLAAINEREHEEESGVNDNQQATEVTQFKRKVSFSDMVKVRRCSVQYEDDCLSDIVVA